MLTINHAEQSFDIAERSRILPEADTTFVFLHGLGCAKESFTGAFEAEALKDHSILTFDFPGFGGSSKPKEFSYTMEAQAAITLKVIDQLNLKNVALVAHSMGGAIGLLVARELDNLVAFVNAEGNLVAEDAGIISRQTAAQDETIFKHKGFGSFLAGLTSSGREDFETWAKWYKNASPVAVHRSAQSLVEWSDNGKLMGYFNDLPHKAYFYGGGYDGKEDKGYVIDQFGDVAVYRFPNSEHFMMLDKPEMFYKSIGEFALDA